MTIRFFMLHAHYRSTLDFSNEALQAAEKGLDRLMNAVETLDRLTPAAESTVDVGDLEGRYTEAMNDDLNSPVAIAALFDWTRTINQLHEGAQKISADDLARLQKLVHTIVFDVLGLRDEKAASSDDHLAPVMELVLELRKGAKEEKNWALSDKIRDGLAAAGIKVMDKKDGTSEWQLQ
jgi:cysteinyl-tRNA synthetase